jgi:hypothetical protein
VLLKWDGTYWSKKSDSDSLVDTGNAYFSKSLNSTIIAFNIPTGLYYDNGSGIVLLFWTDANTLCLNKGMRLPDITETTYNLSTKVPHYKYDVPDSYSSWVVNSYQAGSHDAWKSLTRYWNESTNSFHTVRCVK